MLSRGRIWINGAGDPGAACGDIGAVRGDRGMGVSWGEFMCASRRRVPSGPQNRGRGDACIDSRTRFYTTNTVVPDVVPPRGALPANFTTVVCKFEESGLKYCSKRDGGEDWDQEQVQDQERASVAHRVPACRP
jgi:hypothetical protein